MKKKRKFIVMAFAAILVIAGIFVVYGRKVTIAAPIIQQIRDAGTQPKTDRLCQTVTNPKSDCSYTTLEPYFNNDEKLAKQASAICNLESQGDPSTQSYVDFCRDGNPISFGLFQINIIAQEALIPQCQGVFTKTMNAAGNDVACLKEKNGVCAEYDCRVTDMQKYNSCVAYITGVQENISVAKEVYDQTGSWNDWGSYQFCKDTF